MNLSSQHLDYPEGMQATLVPVEEYLRTNYDPDCEYVDGQIVERNLGEKTHSRIQGEVIFRLWAIAKELGMEVLPEQRVQVSPKRFRIPDVTVLRMSDERIVSSPPFICIEVLIERRHHGVHAGKDRRLSPLRSALHLDHQSAK